MDEKKSFETALAELDKVLKALQEGDIPLEDAIDQYRYGVAMAKLCEEKLTQVEKEIALLSDGKESPFVVEAGERHE